MGNWDKRCRQSCPPASDREAFIRDNAVSLVDALQARIDRQRRALSKINLKCLARGRRIVELENLVEQLAERVRLQSELLGRRAEKQATDVDARREGG